MRVHQLGSGLDNGYYNRGGVGVLGNDLLGDMDTVAPTRRRADRIRFSGVPCWLMVLYSPPWVTGNLAAR
jgi:hypothetical protein